MSALSWRSGAVVWMTGASLVLLGAACGGEDRTPTGPGTTTSSSSSSTSSGGGSGGSGGGSGGQAAGGGGSSSSGTGGGGGIAVSDPACAGDYAFRAAGMSFGPSTPQDLALAFNEMAYGSNEHPVTVVLRATNPAQATVAASPTVDGGNFSEVFVSGLEPTFTSATVKQGSFSTPVPQPTGYLRLRHLQGVLDLQLTNLYLQATTASDCNQAFVVLDAIVPKAERSKSLVTSGGTTTVGDLAGGDPNNDIQLHALFQTEAIDFDFSSL